ncbi:MULTISPECIES: ABC transporter substrate-binding protein [unclassified Halomonas]|uniref:ABC transporter substrate-binding protein n=1 Tax=unclassified Halomonas TaxID=2609666 RepID=UPI0009908AF6|nr:MULTISPECIES: ABC transporter substrate-binding protein [unclassified Halomonas]AQU81973.1 ABC transporter substrate-binding protein [Halomonas sp. 'Soap Lake \
MKRLFAFTGLCAMLGLVSNSAFADATQYPLTLDNCGAEVTFDQAPERAVGLGQASAEIMLLLGLEDKMVGTAFWPNSVLPQLAEANAKVEVLTVEFPTFESILAKEPDLVTAALPSLIGPSSRVATREDFDNVGVATYLSPNTCVSEGMAKDKFGYGSRAQLWSMDALYQEIEELARIFDVNDRGQALIEDLEQREAALRAETPEGGEPLSFVFWFSSPSPSADAYLGGKNGASGFIADVLGGTNAIDSEAEWPALGWEGIIAADPDVIVVARVDRNRWELDKVEAKIEYLNSDSATREMRAVKNGAIVVMDGHAMDPTVRTIFGAEEVAEQLEALGLR